MLYSLIFYPDFSRIFWICRIGTDFIPFLSYLTWLPFIPDVDLAQVQGGATNVYVSVSRLGLVVSQIERNARIAVVASVFRDWILGIFKQTLKNCIDQMSYISQFNSVGRHTNLYFLYCWITIVRSYVSVIGIN